MQVGVAHSAVWRVLREQQLYPYHLQCVQASPLQNYPTRVMFFQPFLRQRGTNFNFPLFAIFTDETQFTRDGIQNSHNHHLWPDKNSHAIFPSDQQQRFSINIWAGFCGDHLFIPHVLQNRLKGGITKLSKKTKCLIPRPTCH
jgi:hypothetical protein